MKLYLIQNDTKKYSADSHFPIDKTKRIRIQLMIIDNNLFTLGIEIDLARHVWSTKVDSLVVSIYLDNKATDLVQNMESVQELQLENRIFAGLIEV